jgi:brefeldin A-inhibited guanine nucleotide-exchange protein
MQTPESESTPFADAHSGGVGSSSEHDMDPSLPPSSGSVGSREVEPEVTGDSEGRRLSNESQPAQSQITLYVMHAITFCIYTYLFILLRQSFVASNPLDALPEMEHTHELTSNDLFVKDAFLVFRALCKLTMKPLNNERFVV